MLICDLTEGGILISANRLWQQLSKVEFHVCSVKHLETIGCKVFGVDFRQIEILTASLSNGLLLDTPDFEAFLAGVGQIVDGQFEFIRFELRGKNRYTALTLRCVDSSFWQAHSSDSTVISLLEACGFVSR
jgi:hypothetical protein